jgi:hypothetical protein
MTFLGRFRLVKPFESILMLVFRMAALLKKEKQPSKQYFGGGVLISNMKVLTGM